MGWFEVRVAVRLPADSREAAELEVQQGRDRLLIDEVYHVRIDVADEPLLEMSGSTRPAWHATLRIGIEADSAEETLTAAGDPLHERLAAIFEDARVTAVEPIQDPRRPALLCRHALEEAASWISDQLEVEIEGLASGGGYETTTIVRQHLPPCFALHYTPELVGRWVEVVERTAVKLLAYPDTYLASTAEELAGHALIEEARFLLDLQKADRRAVVDSIGQLDEIHDLVFEPPARGRCVSVSRGSRYGSRRSDAIRRWRLASLAGAVAGRRYGHNAGNGSQARWARVARSSISSPA